MLRIEPSRQVMRRTDYHGGKTAIESTALDLLGVSVCCRYSPIVNAS